MISGVIDQSLRSHTKPYIQLDNKPYRFLGLQVCGSSTYFKCPLYDVDDVNDDDDDDYDDNDGSK